MRWLTAYIRNRYITAMADPLREPTFLILTALAGEPLHGYGIITGVKAISEGKVGLRPGTLYGAIDRLIDEGLVEDDHEEVVDGRLRRYYRLTDDGAATLNEAAERMHRNAESATKRLRARTANPGLTTSPVVHHLAGGFA